MTAWGKRLVAVAVAVVVLAGAVLVGSAVHLLPQLRNPFAERTEEHSGPVLLQSIVELSRYEAASGSFQVVVDIKTTSVLPSFLAGSDTLFIGVGTDNAFVDFSRLKGDAVQVSDDRLSAKITLGHAQLEPATLDVHESHVYAQQQGLFTRINEFLTGNPNSQQALYELAQKEIQAAAAKSSLIADAERNTKAMLTGLLQSLGFKTITVDYADSNPG
ncbi:DUF4230 domain-containing protein [Amycolatopsis sp. A133]|jgi:hypothetical protein|uniref:DUF4230 domain-containing protein n=1 Tax=Amycolatopsis sp. A133 TaxID=3064472 RepID=UPI0027EF3B3F|nr:DUF4230 domain-containing protein [Amycolatopsis sp. A133]MDQ7808759.1 DUF4230 domain-containing protein [Amycolatopsis sp. A133]